MKKLLIIWNNNASYITNSLVASAEKIIGTGNFKISIIATEEKLNDLLQSGFIPNFIFILLELNWTNSIYYGYNIAETIIQKIVIKEYAPTIQFISLIKNRKDVFQDKNNIKKIYSKSFKHYFYRDNIEYQFPITSIRKWRYLKKFALTNSGQLRTIKHSIENSTFKKEHFEQLIMLNDICGMEINSLLDSNKDKIKDEEIVSLLNNRIALLDNLVRETEFKKLDVNVLLVEDAPEWNKRLRKIFQNYFNNITTVECGQEALRILSQEGDFFDLLITDLELVEREYPVDQDVTGIEIIDFVEENYPHLVIRVISGLSETGINILLEDFVSNVLAKRNIHLINEDYVKKIEDEVIAKSKSRRLIGPKTAIWSRFTDKGFGGDLLRFYHGLSQEYRDKIWNEVFARFENKEIDMVLPSPQTQTEFVKRYLGKGKKEQLIKHLKTILVQRLFWLDKLYDGTNSAYYIPSISEVDTLDYRLESANYRFYYSLWGFSIRLTEAKFKFTFNQLFNEEKEWLLKRNTEIDFANRYGYLADTIFDIHTLSGNNGKNFYPKDMKDIYETLSKIDLVRIADSNLQKIRRLLLEFKENAADEWEQLDEKIVLQISNIIN